MDKEDLKHFFELVNRNNKIIGNYEVKYLESEIPARKNARRSLVAAKKIPKGKMITLDDITWKRPGNGLSPKYIDNVLGKKALVDIEEDEIIFNKNIN